MTTHDTDLATALKQAKTKRMFFALIVKGTEGRLLVDKKKISPKDIAAAKEECGGGTVYKGRCQGEDGGAIMVFEVAKEPPGTLANTTKKIIKENSGLTFRAVEFRIAADAEDETEESENQEASKSGGEKAPTPTPTPTPPSSPADAASKRFGERLKVLTPLLQHALATGKPQAEQAKAKMVEANTAFRNKAADQANGFLDQAEPLIKQALASVAKPAPSDAGTAAKPVAPAPPAGAADTQAWKTQYALVEPQYQEALKNNAPDANKLRALMAFATGKADAGEYSKALAGLKQLEPFLRPTAPKPTAPDAAKPADHDAFFKEWAAAREELEIAVDQVSNQLAQFASAILETNEPNLVWVAEEGLSQMLSSLRENAVAIDKATSKTPAKVVAKAKPFIAKLRTQLQTAEVKACDDNKLGVSVTINSTISGAIKQLEETFALANAS